LDRADHILRAIRAGQHDGVRQRTGVARTPLRKGERLRDKIEAQLAKIKTLPRLVGSFFQAPSVADISDF
jgi:hypothetical protein